MKRITFEELVKAGACSSALRRFKRRFGNSCTIRELTFWIKEIDEPDWFGWLVCNFLVRVCEDHCSDCPAYKVRFVGKKVGRLTSYVRNMDLYNWFGDNTAKAAADRVERIIDKLEKEKKPCASAN